MNNKKIKKLAEKAGFIYWQDETWGPGPDFIDWSSNYDNELAKYTELVVRKCAEIADKAEPYKASDLIKSKFGLKDED